MIPQPPILLLSRVVGLQFWDAKDLGIVLDLEVDFMLSDFRFAVGSSFLNNCFNFYEFWVQNCLLSMLTWEQSINLRNEIRNEDPILPKDSTIEANLPNIDFATLHHHPSITGLQADHALLNEFKEPLNEGVHLKRDLNEHLSLLAGEAGH